MRKNTTFGVLYSKRIRRRRKLTPDSCLFHDNEIFMCQALSKIPFLLGNGGVFESR